MHLKCLDDLNGGNTKILIAMVLYIPYILNRNIITGGKVMRIGIIGCGVAIQHHIPAIRNVKGAEIVGISDIRTDKLENVANRFNIENKFTDFFVMIKQQRPDIVFITTPPRTHAPIAIQVMDLGCNVLVEKPMAITTEEADAMIEASKKNNVKLCVVHQHLFDPHIQRAKRLLETGVLGDIVYAEVKYYLDNKKMIEEQTDNPEHWVYMLPMSIYGEYTPHLIYLLLSFLNKIDSVQVLEKNINNEPPPAVGGLAVQLSAKKAIGRLLMFYCMDHEHFSIDIFGTKAALHINMLDLTVILEKERNLPSVLARMFTTVEQGFQGIIGIIANLFRIAFGKLKRRPGHRNLVKIYIEAVQNDEAPPVTGEEGREVVRVLKMIEDGFQSDTRKR